MRTGGHHARERLPADHGAGGACRGGGTGRALSASPPPGESHPRTRVISGQPVVGGDELRCVHTAHHLRDELERLPVGARDLTYKLVAQIPGEYCAMPTQVFNMYDPTIRATGTADDIVVAP